MTKLSSTQLLIAGVVYAFLAGQTVAADKGKDSGYKLVTKTRLIHFDREFEVSTNDRTQTALGITADWTTPQYGGWFGLGISPFFIEDLDDSGRITEDVLTVNDGEMDGFAKIGQAFIKLTPSENVTAKIGRQTHKSLLMTSSYTRAAPDSYQGVNLQVMPAKGLTFQAAAYNKFVPRANEEAMDFSTDRSTKGAIDYIALLNVKYKHGPFSIEAEYLNSDDYLSKYGLVGSYTTKLSGSKLTLTAGAFGSMDDGSLFVTGAEGAELDDENETGAVLGVTDSENDGFGAYLDAKWNIGNFQLNVAVAQFDGAWIEDNYAGDPGTNPFPTRSIVGPDMTNANETLYLVGLKYDWKDIIPGLVTSIAHVDGRDAENSAVSSLGSADEVWDEVVVTYTFPMVKGLKFIGRWHDYDSDKTGQLDGVKGDETDIWLYLDYTYTFNI